MCQLHRTAVIRYRTHPNRESTIITTPDSHSQPKHQNAFQKPDQKPYLITFSPRLPDQDLVQSGWHSTTNPGVTLWSMVYRL